MSTEPPGAYNLEAIIGVVYRVAQMHGTSVALSDLLPLLPADASKDEVSRAFSELPSLAQKYSLEDGLIISKSMGAGPSVGDERARIAASNMRIAEWLSSGVGNGDIVTLAVSGSTSYRAASRWDDVDIFCVTRPDRLWLFMAKALLLARASKLADPSRTPICLSCVMDAPYASELFARDRGALVARDALVADVITGRTNYERLIASAPWMERYFPRLYTLRMGSDGGPRAYGTQGSPWMRAANRFLFLLVGGYVRAKARFHNRLLRTEGKVLASFEAKLGPDHLIYESAKYQTLRKIYETIPASPDGATSDRRRGAPLNESAKGA